MENLLKARKLRVTPFRIDVLKVFQKYENAIDMAVIEAELVNFDRITLYRTIKAFLKAGVIHEILLNGETKKYALCAEACESSNHKHDHIHFLCTKCEETFCLDTIEMPVLNHPTFQISTFDIQAKGVCETCQ